MASSQIACVNFLLPLIGIEGALAAVLRAIDSDVQDVMLINHKKPQGPPRPLNWSGSVLTRRAWTGPWRRMPGVFGAR